jgi:hypothetical protein
MPPESRLCVSAITGQSLFYLGQKSLAHKVLSVAEVQGAQRAAYALKLLTGDGDLSIASTGKDPRNGALVTRTYQVQGPVALFLTTTATALDDELTNRVVVLAMDDDQAQTRAILGAQRHAQTLAGLAARNERPALRALHANAQRLLEPLAVVNPHALQLTFADRRTRARRDQAHLLTLIQAITLLHQYQRPRRRITRDGRETIYIEATADDVRTAQQLAVRFTGTSDLADLAPQTRHLLELLDALVTTEAQRQDQPLEAVRFTRRQAREEIGWSDFALRRHLARLVQLELVRGRRLRGTFSYELMWASHAPTADTRTTDTARNEYDTDVDTPSRASRGHLDTPASSTPAGS